MKIFRRLAVWVLLPALAIIPLLTCSSGGGGGDDGDGDGDGPNLGSWSGEDITFSVNAGSKNVSNFEVTIVGECPWVWFVTSFGFSSPQEISNNKFSYTSGTDNTINGTFTDANNATIDVYYVHKPEGVEPCPVSKTFYASRQ